MKPVAVADASEKELGWLLRAGYRVIAFESFEEERALRVLERAAVQAERALVVWSLAAGVEGRGAGSFDGGLRELEALDKPLVLVVLDAQTVLAEPMAVRRLRDALPRLAQRRQTVVLLGPVVDLPLELEREASRLTLPLPTADELRRLFERVASGSNAPAPAGDVLDECVRAAQGLTSAEAVRVLRKAWLAAGAFDGSAVAHVLREKQKALRRVPALSFQDASDDLTEVGGLGELKRWLAERRRAFGAEARAFGLPVPRGLLLLGVQGCGKSLSAKAVAREWRFPLLRLDLAAAFGDRSRSPEVTMREATAVAESLAPAVLWIDEIEKGFAATDRDPAASRVFGAFLTWLAEKEAPVFVVATANDVTALPPELLRRGRFDELFFVDLPSEVERVEILSIHLKKRGRDPKQFPLAELAARAMRLSGAELEQVVASGLYKAFCERRELSENDLANAIEETVPLYETYEERIKELRDWARTRARPATLDARIVDLFGARRD
jgi:ATP-dependent 26S proteasome regulatory subunit